MRTFKLKIISPDKILFDGEAQYCGITTLSGAIGFEARHEPIAAILKENSEVRLRDADGSEKTVVLKDGILVFKDNSCTITATAAK
jgi:F-type H+-transporting ATPase subunit epsilon